MSDLMESYKEESNRDVDTAGGLAYRMFLCLACNLVTLSIMARCNNEMFISVRATISTSPLRALFKAFSSVEMYL